MTASPDGIHSIALNLSVIAPGFVVMGGPSAERRSGEALAARDWVGDVAHSLREMFGSRFIRVHEPEPETPNPEPETLNPKR